ncbi:MAG: glycosyltransferase family 2 protein [Thermoanaerobaculaceae bacterium]|nr:glycosyltransferase family 2 protein [Thermoanaerobaculaceae bacterium]MDI9622672.1 glycosyltransferase family 2 protein [Acidobacteriota bacterium]NLH09987.1 glycosyltransferase family 2 protein [Holophagae bacterium]HPW54579.1 glycosyltransferase family 2 protein [Thermoanaerobaculaceae bacterium]
MKLVIQVPAWNEEEHLTAALAELPRQVAGFDEVEVLVVDDGSTDRTSQVAREAGSKVARLPLHRGLARTFTMGLETALTLGADVIVNTDADGQYDPTCIEPLTAPILAGEADIVLGDRGVATLRHFSPVKRLLQRLGSWVVQLLSGVPVPDATTGFRAFSRRAAARLSCFTTFTYTLETLIQAGQSGFAVRSVPIRTRETSRPSRLFRSNLSYVLISLVTLLRLVFIYRPLRSLLALACVCWLPSLFLLGRFAYYYLTEISPAGHVQSLIVGAVLALTGVQLTVLGALADLTAVNRRMLDEIRGHQREAR